MEIQLSKVVNAPFHEFLSDLCILRDGSAKLTRKVIYRDSVRAFEEFFNVPTMLRKEFEQLHNIKSQNVDYLLEQNRIDYTLVGHTKIIIINEKAEKYKPNKNKNRTAIIGSDILRT